MSTTVVFGRCIRAKSRFKPPFKQNKRAFSLFLVSFVNAIKAFFVFESNSEFNSKIKFSIYLVSLSAILHFSRCAVYDNLTTRMRIFTCRRHVMSREITSSRTQACTHALKAFLPGDYFFTIYESIVRGMYILLSNLKLKRLWNNVLQESLFQERMKN